VVSADGTGVVAHAGNVATRLLADQVGLTGALSTAVARRGFTPGHDRGRVLTDVAVLIGGGGEAIADINTLRHQREVLGSVASAPTVWRTLKGLTPAAAKRIDKARAKVRAHVWSQLPGGLPASKVADTDLGDVVVLDVDATLVAVHSEKEGAASTFKKGFGYHPIGVWCDNTQESLALMLRKGNAGSNDTAHHIAVLTAAIAQVPAAHRKKLLIRADGAGASHGLLDWLSGLNARRGRTVEYSVGFAITEKVRTAIAKVPEHAWSPAIDPEGAARANGDVVEITGMLDLSTWPDGMRVLIRREHPHPGAALSLFEEADGWRYQAVAINTPLPRVVRSRSSKRATVRTPGSRPESGTRRTPASAASPPASSPSTRPGWSRLRSQPTSSPGSECWPYLPPSRPASRKRCGTGSCTSPPA
jgi:hypothetical protein